MMAPECLLSACGKGISQFSPTPVYLDCSNILNRGSSARARRDSSISTRGWRRSRQSRSFCQVFIFM